MFLTLGDALLAGSIALAFLLLLYVLKLRRRPVRISSIIFWRSAPTDAQANEPFQMLRFSWLLLLHLFIILLIIAALARPVVPDALNISSRVAVIIDVSASMSARDIVESGEGTSEPVIISRFDAAQREAIALVGKLLSSGGTRQAAIIAMGSDPIVLAPMTGSRAQLQSALDQLAPTDQPAELGKALLLAKSMESGSSESQAPQPLTLILISDGGCADELLARGSREVEAAGLLPRVRFIRTGPALVANQPLRTPNPPSTGPSSTTPTTTGQLPAPASPATPLLPERSGNSGITTFSARWSLQDPGRLLIFVQVLNNRPKEITAPLSLSLNGASITSRVLTVPPEETASTSITLDQVPGGLLTVSLPAGDALASDDSASLIITPAKKPALLLVHPDAATPQAKASARWLLSDALSEMPAKSLEVISLTDYRTRAAAKQLSSIDCIIFDAVDAGLPPPGCPTLSFGGAPSFDGITLTRSTKGSEQGDAQAVFWQRNHPIFTNATLDGVIIGDESFISLSPQAAGWEEVATSQRGGIIVSGPALGARHIICAFDLARTNWPLTPSFAIFLVDSLAQLTGTMQAPPGRAYRTTDPAFIRTNGQPCEIRLQGPAPLVPITITAPPSAGGEPTWASTGVLSRSGIYLIKGRCSLDDALAINLCNIGSSRLRSPLLLSPATASTPAQRGKNDPLISLELWPWCIALAGLLLMVEWVLYLRGVRG